MSNVETINELLTGYAELRRLEEAHWKAQGYKGAEDAGMELPALTSVALKAAPEGDALETSNALEKAVADEKWHEGWVRHRSGIWWKIGGQVGASVSEAELGPPVWGEWARDADGVHESVHLKPDAQAPGKFRFWTYAERELEAGDRLRAGEFAALCQRVEVLVEPVEFGREKIGENKVLAYHVFWGGTEDDPHGIRRLCYRFVGFADRKDS